MPSRRTGFGDDLATQGYDITQGYRDYNPRFDKTWVQEQVAPYKDYGLSQNIADYARKSDTQLYDMSAAAVIKMAQANGTIAPPPKPPGAPKPPKSPKPKPPRRPPKPKPPRKPRPPKSPKPVPTPPRDWGNKPLPVP